MNRANHRAADARRRPELVGLFDDRTEAERALIDLEQAGFGKHDIGFVIRGSQDVAGGMITDAVGTKDAKGAFTGAVTGGVVGGMLAAALALFLPGVGPVLVGGVIVSFFGGALAGVATGGFLGAMEGLGVSEHEARRYEKEFHAGRAIVAVHSGSRTDEAAAILRKHGGYEIHSESGGPIDTDGVLARP